MLNDNLASAFNCEYLWDRLCNHMVTTGITLATDGTAQNIAFSDNCVVRVGQAELALTAASDKLLFASGSPKFYNSLGEQVTASQIAVNATNNPSGGSGVRLVILIGIDASKNAYMIASPISTGLTGALKIPYLPSALTSTVAIVGYATITVTRGNVWTPGTTAFDGTGVTTEYTSKMILTGGESITLS